MLLQELHPHLYPVQQNPRQAAADGQTRAVCPTHHLGDCVQGSQKGACRAGMLRDVAALSGGKNLRCPGGLLVVFCCWRVVSQALEALLHTQGDPGRVQVAAVLV